MRLCLSRRLLLASLAALPAGRAFAATAGMRHVEVACWGGPYGAAIREVVDGRAAGLELVVGQHPGTEPERVAQLLSQDAGGIDVGLLSDVDAYRLSLRQMFVPLTTAGVPSLPSIVAGLRSPYGVPQGRTALTIAYNTGRVRTAPRGFREMFAQARKGRVGFSSQLAIHNLAAAAISEQHDGPASLQAARSVFSGLRKAGVLRLYADNEALGTALAKGEIDMAPMWRSRAHIWQQQGHPVHDQVPVEGAIPFTIMGCIPTASKQQPAAMAYLDLLLHGDVQRAMAEKSGLLPTVNGVRLDAALATRIGFTAAQQARFRPLSLDAVARNGLELRHFWDHDLA
ncbi:ABC transporter substrate-binding protein [Lichenicoccus roseus]|uniref:Extracellular solute-binding protein n=1 Tax=Lichenicoccus roseus TaxID=2683649 RepID=A0A5R9J418_9PROT|nr:extracellular solute-binding protein [Lichenicoccus roseus]TLU72292.1 extracellular solute-binding protein [Lichenicoccus roseus]